jgi:glyoxylase-like metal-dependent hydrolase (beta-lactamase superfamily II)
MTMNTTENSSSRQRVPQPARRRFLQMLGAGALGALAGAGVMERATAYWYASQLEAPLPPANGRYVQPAAVTTASGLKIHHIQTGYVAVKTAHHTYSGADGTGILAIIADRQWTPWMPIHVWLIEHPEGLILVDTGETIKALDADYFACDPGTQFFYQSFLRFALSRDDEIDRQLADLGVRPTDIRWVVQTHLHGDHVGGLSHVGRSPVLVPAADYPNAIGTLPCRYPAGFAPIAVRFSLEPAAGFAQSCRLTQRGDVVIVPTPGHSGGHQSVVLLDTERDYFFAGDVAFSEEQLTEGVIGGIAAEPAAARQTLTQIREWCRGGRTVFLPSHDPGARERLLNGQATLI